MYAFISCTRIWCTRTQKRLTNPGTYANVMYCYKNTSFHSLISFSLYVDIQFCTFQEQGRTKKGTKGTCIHTGRKGNDNQQSPDNCYKEYTRVLKVRKEESLGTLINMSHSRHRVLTYIADCIGQSKPVDWTDGCVSDFAAAEGSDGGGFMGNPDGVVSDAVRQRRFRLMSTVSDCELSVRIKCWALCTLSVQNLSNFKHDAKICKKYQC